MNKELEENKKTIEEMKKLKEEIESSIDSLKSTAKESFISLIMRSIVAGCASNAIDSLSKAFLPKNLRGIAKIGVTAGTFFLPEIIGNIAANKVESILEED